ncbi:Hypp4618 [Branchiostoma lanceolatum]|uniref:Hypp4618 protein n=1 Tax=Branchiostoma lanceolatum TaxID=7740 RepID=A0A8K0A942_BRALA|nr:Hypp4618 [Branchiostoma lanceolatum]
MGVLDKAASAYLTVVQTLSLLRPGGKRRTGEAKLSVTVHEGKVGRHSQGKYVVTLRHGKEKQQTKKKKSDGLVWEHAAEFSHWTPTDPLILKLRKAKRCKDATIAELPIDVAAALESVDGLPNRWWYAIERIDDKGRRQKEEVFLQVTITVDGPGVISGSKHAKPTKATVTTEAQDKPSTKGEVDVEPHHERRSSVSREEETGTSDRSRRTDATPPAAAGDITDVKSEQPSSTSLTSSPPASCDTPDQAGTRGRGEGDVEANTERHSRDKSVEIPQVASAVDATGDNDSGRGQEPTRPSGKTVMTVGQESPEASAELKEVTAVSTDVEVTAVSTDVEVTAVSTDEEVTVVSTDVEVTTVSTDVEVTAVVNAVSTDVEVTAVSTDVEVTAVSTDVEVTAVSTDVEVSAVSTDVEVTAVSTDVGVTAVSTDVDVALLEVPTAVDSPVSESDSERDQGPAKPSKETTVQETPEHLEDVTSLSKNEELDFPANANSDVDTDRPKTVSSTRGGGLDLPPAIPHPRHKDADDPHYKEMMSSIDDLWDDLITKREYADELQAYADSLRSKLAATAPHVLNYTVIKNLAAQVPVCKSYDSPQTEGLSLAHLKDIQDTLTKLLKDEENRAWYLRRWYIDELCNVALKEAPQVLSAQD